MRTIKCEKCSIGNTVDSKFCRHCGQELSADAMAKLIAENEVLVSDGRRLLSDGRSAEAKLVAESVLESDPSSVKALALLGDAYEKEGKLDEAVGTYEQVCELAPDSSIDRIRLAHLRKLQAAGELAVVAPVDQRRNVTVGVLASVLLLSVVAALVLSSMPAQASTGKDSLVAQNENNPVGFRSYAPALVPNVPTTTGGNGAVTDTTANARVGTGETGLRNPNRVTPGYSRPAGDANSSVPPWNPFPGGNPTITPSKNNTTSTANGNQDPDPNGTFDPNKNNSGSNSGTVAEDPGIVEITVVDGNKNQGKVDGGSNVDDKSAEVLIQKARNLYLQGDYSGAAGAYEQAIRAGAGGGATYQRLAQCYEKIGRKSDAIGAYRRAASAYESQIQRGQGNSRIQTALDACKRAITALGG